MSAFSKVRVLITGANGFIGRNLQVNLGFRSECELLLFDLPQTTDDLQHLVHQADFVFHLAGVNRSSDSTDFQTGNVDLTNTMLCVLEKEQRKIPLVFTSSTQAQLDNTYGRSKRSAEDLVFDYAERNNAPVYVYRLPNVFGKWCKPNYNSVVATFCHNAANGIPLRVDDPEKEITLLYVDDIVAEFAQLIDGNTTLKARGILSILPTHQITLGYLAETITGFADSRRELMQNFDRSDMLLKKLYATFSSYVPSDTLVISPEIKYDERGFFTELIKSPYFGQISMSRTKPGVTRGNHWHNTKVEKFIVVEGKAVIKLRKLESEDTYEYIVSGDVIRIVDIPPGYTHSIQNIGENDVITLFWTGDMFDPENPDTAYEKV